MSDFDTIEHASATVPGTVYLVDVNHKDDSLLYRKDNDDIVLVPQPTRTIRDPLVQLVSVDRKGWSLFLAALFACIMSFGENNLGAAWTTISDDTNVSLSNMNGGSALNYLLLGFVNILWIPTAMKIGRKFVYVAAMTLVMVASVWNAYIYGTTQWYLNNLVGGLGQSAYQAIIQLTVFDIFFAHQRGTALAFYIWSQQLGSVQGLILGGYIAEGPGWRWSCKIVAILSGAVALLFLFTFDDTLFPRHALRALDTSEGFTGPVVRPQATTGEEKSKTVNTSGADVAEVEHQLTATEPLANWPPRTYIQVLNPIHYFPSDKTTWFQYFRRPFILFLFPNIVVAGIIFAFGCTAGIVSFNTISEIMTDAPYNWGSGPTGLMFLAALIGSFIGMGTGYLGDRIVISLARRNGGYKEPEMRLWTLCFSFVYASIGYFSYGWAAQRGESWVVIAVGLGAMIAHQVSATSIATAYAMESFEGISGELVVVLAICSSCINFAMSFSVQPFIDATNYGPAFSFFGGLVLGSMLLAIPTYIWGKSWRRRCAARYNKFLVEAVTT